MVEYLVWVDDDDEETLEFLTRGEGFPPMKLIVISGPRGRGYLDLHVGLNILASLSRGDWVFCFNDDAEMVTGGWDRAFSGQLGYEGQSECRGFGDEGFGCPDGICMLVPHTLDRPESQEFFAVHRRVYEVLGHLAPNMGIDDWLADIVGKIGRKVRCNIEISHRDEEDLTFREGRGSLSPKDIYELTASFRVVRDRLSDVIKLMDYIEGFGK